MSINLTYNGTKGTKIKQYYVKKSSTLNCFHLRCQNKTPLEKTIVRQFKLDHITQFNKLMVPR